jgi:preprotein translocase subunit SecE
MAKDQGIVPTAFRRRTPLAATSATAGAPAAPKKPFNPIQFLRETRAEARKVTWTSWKETWITSVMVGIMVILTAFFFFGVDAILNLVIGAVLKMASA